MQRGFACGSVPQWRFWVTSPWGADHFAQKKVNGTLAFDGAWKGVASEKWWIFFGWGWLKMVSYWLEENFVLNDCLRLCKNRKWFFDTSYRGIFVFHNNFYILIPTVLSTFLLNLNRKQHKKLSSWITVTTIFYRHNLLIPSALWQYAFWHFLIFPINFCRLLSNGARVLAPKISIVSSLFLTYFNWHVEKGGRIRKEKFG